MGGKAKKTIFHEKIQSPEQFMKIIEKSQGGGPIAIIDAHLAWCGPCEPMVANYQSMWYNYDEPEKRLGFWQCPEECFPEDMVPPNLTLVPKFLVYGNGELKTTIDGAKYN